MSARTLPEGVTVVLVKAGTLVKHGRWNEQETRIDRVYDVLLDGERIGAVERRMFTRERRSPGRRYVNARWQSPGWGVPHTERGWGSREFTSRNQAVEAIVKHHLREKSS